jgi:hypothetical protein
LLLIGRHRKRGHGVRCDTTAELDVLTLIWTRVEAMALDLLPERLQCPICGNRKIKFFFDIPDRRGAKPAR